MNENESLKLKHKLNVNELWTWWFQFQEKTYCSENNFQPCCYIWSGSHALYSKFCPTMICLRPLRFFLEKSNSHSLHHQQKTVYLPVHLVHFCYCHLLFQRRLPFCLFIMTLAGILGVRVRIRLTVNSAGPDFMKWGVPPRSGKLLSNYILSRK